VHAGERRARLPRSRPGDGTDLRGGTASGSGSSTDLDKNDISEADEKCRDKLPQIRKGGGK